jgi:hypothetical protein
MHGPAGDAVQQVVWKWAGWAGLGLALYAWCCMPGHLQRSEHLHSGQGGALALHAWPPAVPCSHAVSLHPPAPDALPAPVHQLPHLLQAQHGAAGGHQLGHAGSQVAGAWAWAGQGVSGGHTCAITCALGLPCVC